MPLKNAEVCDSKLNFFCHQAPRGKISTYANLWLLGRGGVYKWIISISIFNGFFVKMFREPERKSNGTKIEVKQSNNKEEDKEVHSKEDATKEINSDGGATPISLEPETSDTPITLEDTVSLHTFK